MFIVIIHRHTRIKSDYLKNYITFLYTFGIHGLPNDGIVSLNAIVLLAVLGGSDIVLKTSYLLLESAVQL